MNQMTKHYAATRDDFLESIQHGVVLCDGDGHVTYWNKATETIFGYTKKEASGRHLGFILHDEALAELEKLILNQNGAHSPVSGRWPCKHKEGREAWVDVRFNKYKNSHFEEAQIIATVCDIQGLKCVERELEESEARKQAILESSVDGIITIDESGLIQSFNKAAQKIFGYREDEVLGKNLKMLMPLPFSEKHDKYMQNYFETGEKKIIGKGREVQGLKKDGTVFPMDLSVGEARWNGNRIFTGIVKDITERKELEKKILEISNDERKRIGQDLHDGLGQMLTGIRMISGNLARKLKANGVPGADEVQEITNMLSETDEFVRSITHDMVEVDLEKKGLDVALKKLCERNEKLFKIRCIFQNEESVLIDQNSVAVNLYRIAQEAIHNAVKHGRPKMITVRLSKSGRHTSLTVTDDGKGFNDHKKTEDKSGMGIKIMKYRASLMGGILEIVRTEDDKTIVRCIIPNDQLQF
jgi:two-component system, LuxR family, sensor kinase FixL